ncbi:hypothetical protein MRX96_006414 [Rhipicephalus microplus]
MVWRLAPLHVPSHSITGKRVLTRRFPQGCNNPGCVRPEIRLHRSLLQSTQLADTLPARVAGTFERAALGQARDRSSGPGPINRHFAGQRGRSHRLHRRSGVEAGPLRVSSHNIAGKRVLKRRFPQGCSDPGCVRPEIRLHRSLLQPAQWSDTLPARVAGTFERAAPGQARDCSSGPGPINRHFAGQRGRSHRLHQRWVTIGLRHDANRLPGFEPTTPPIHNNECIASSLVW